MIIQIRGTSGSGKTTVMRELIEAIAPLDDWDKHFIEGRRKPIVYTISKGGQSFAVLGHYESACGGCDNVGSAAKVYALYQQLQFMTDANELKLGYKVDVILSEGLLLSEDAKWSSQLKGLTAVFLSTKIDECIRRVNSRRAKAGNDTPVNEKNTRNRVRAIESARIRLDNAGVNTVRYSSRQATRKILQLIAKNHAK